MGEVCSSPKREKKERMGDTVVPQFLLRAGSHCSKISPSAHHLQVLALPMPVGRLGAKPLTHVPFGDIPDLNSSTMLPVFCQKSKYCAVWEFQ